MISLGLKDLTSATKDAIPTVKTPSELSVLIECISVFRNGSTELIFKAFLSTEVVLLFDLLLPNGDAHFHSTRVRTTRILLNTNLPKHTPVMFALFLIQYDLR